MKDMQALSLLVARYGALATRESTARESVARAISEATATRVEPSEVEVLDGEVRVKVSGARRAALFLKREAATAAAAAALGKVLREIR
jgi:hypothetical protein